METRTVTVLGAGTMGRGIAQVTAQAGFEVYLRDIDDAILESAVKEIRNSLSRLVKKGELSNEDGDGALQRIKTTTSFDVVADSDFVIEAVTEKLELKAKIFSELDTLVKPHIVLATNTSSLPITAVAAATSRPERVIGMHFMNPVPVMRGVELVKGRLTSEKTTDEAVNFTRKIGKTPVIAVDYAGFITSRVLNAYLNEAAYSVMDGNTPKDVDDAMVYCTNMPIGPCALMDMVGIDVIVYVLNILEEEFGPKFKSAPLLKQMVYAGHLGRKSGHGFYSY